MENQQSKRNTVRKLNQMNGDFLVQLKRPLCSELRQDVRGHNFSHVITLKRELDVMYRHRNIQLSKVRRSQDAAYATMLRLHKEKKMLQRQGQKQLQQQIRAGHPHHVEALNVDQDISTQKSKVDGEGFMLELKPLPEIPSIKVHDGNAGGETTERSTNPGEKLTNIKINDTQHPIHMAKVLEVRKGAPLQPLTRERSDPKINELLQKEKSPSDQTLTQFSKIDQVLLPAAEQISFSPEIKNDSHTSVSPRIPTKTRARYRHKKRGKPSMPPIDEHSDSDSCTSKTDDELPLRQNGASTPETKSSSSLESRKVSQVKKNKLKAKRRDRQRKEILDTEAITVFVKSSRGEIVPSITPFRRKTFEPPSLREKYFQDKMLRAQIEARISQENRVDEFFEKLEAEGRQRQQRLRDLRAAEAAAVAAAAEAKKTTKPQNIVSLQDVMTAFGRVAQIPSDVDPQSFEALQYCKYLRGSDYFDTQNSSKERTYKASSWSLAQ